MKRIAFIALMLIALAVLTGSCRSRKTCPGMTVEKESTEQPQDTRT